MVSQTTKAAISCHDVLSRSDRRNGSITAAVKALKTQTTQNKALSKSLSQEAKVIVEKGETTGIFGILMPDKTKPSLD